MRLPPVIEAEGLTRWFGDRRAVDHLDLHVEAGDGFGLLGPNGAGKTTTIRMLTTALAPSAGTARVCGFDICRQPQEVRRRIGLRHATNRAIQPLADRPREGGAGSGAVPRSAVGDSGDVHVYVDDAAEALPAVMRLCLSLGTYQFRRQTGERV